MVPAEQSAETASGEINLSQEVVINLVSSTDICGENMITYEGNFRPGIKSALGNTAFQI